LALATVGLYGLTAYSVTRRTGEIGVRMAMGATRSNVLGMIMRNAMLQIGIGLVIGIPITLRGGRVMASQLYGVKIYDPATLLFAVAILAACAALAGFVPARRASSIEPMKALRTE
jgi:ABC-type antimicrobial peptide transport system permease subunit